MGESAKSLITLTFLITDSIDNSYPSYSLTICNLKAIALLFLYYYKFWEIASTSNIELKSLIIIWVKLSTIISDFIFLNLTF